MMTCEEKGKNSYEFLIRYVGNANISITVTNGELVFAASWGRHSWWNHNLIKQPQQPNWDNAQELLEEIYKDDRDSFFKIIEVMDTHSQGYRLIRKIAKKQIANPESQISKVMKEAEFWKKIL